jgi:hypothetical protein
LASGPMAPCRFVRTRIHSVPVLARFAPGPNRRLGPHVTTATWPMSSSARRAIGGRWSGAVVIVGGGRVRSGLAKSPDKDPTQPLSSVPRGGRDALRRAPPQRARLIGGLARSRSPQRFALRAPRPRFRDPLNRRLGIVPSDAAGEGRHGLARHDLERSTAVGPCELREWAITLANGGARRLATVGVVPPLSLHNACCAVGLSRTTARGSDLYRIRASPCDEGDLRGSLRAGARERPPPRSWRGPRPP